ncbi:DnaJ family domain-containing protein [Salinisphaera sp. T31B1]|uniref:DnaJ family domain-containing protein n=1 Tax=Salinisphaera sp. T31B1 TaxID=727963 RepID=UPI003342623E
MSLLDRLADAHIEAAVERGEFDDLSGSGRPLPPDPARRVPAELRAGYRLLKNAGFVPPEIEAQRQFRDLETLLETVEPRSAEAERLTRRLRWLETRLRSTRQGRALLRRGAYAETVRSRLAGGAPDADT